MQRLICTLALLAACAFADTLDFCVVAPGATNVQVSIAGVTTTLPAKYTGIGYFRGPATATDNGSLKYKYIVDGVTESFDRTFATGRKKTYNDFFQRQETLKTLTPLGWPFGDNSNWNRSVGPNGVFDDDYISTIIFGGGEPTAQFFKTVSSKTKIQNQIIAIINRDDTEYFTDVEVNVEDTSQRKPNMKLEFSKNYKKRSDYKLRPSVSDPVFMRDKLYNDILGAAGCPHAESGFARVYINGVGLGLYNLQDKPASKDFIKTQFYGKNVQQPDPLGDYLDATTGADFSQSTDIYTFVPSKNGTNAKIKLLIDALAAVDSANTASIDAFDKNWFHVDYFFKAIALEYLSGHYDSYWFQTTNFLMYDDPTESTANVKKFYFVDQDFDQTYGINLNGIYNPYGAQWTVQPYSIYVNANWTVVPYDAPHRTMVDKLLNNPTYKARFEQILKTIVTGLWNPIALNRRIDSISSRIRPEIEWDYGLGENRAHPGNATFVLPWVLADYDNAFSQPVGGNFWGLKTFIEERSNFVAKQFGLTFINPPLDPPAQPTSSTGTISGTTVTGQTTQQQPTVTGSNPGSGSTGVINTGNVENSEASKSIISCAVLAAIALFAF